jgi:hypothetical protein
VFGGLRGQVTLRRRPSVWSGLLLALVLVTSPAHLHAGGTAFRVKIRNFSRLGLYGARFTAVALPDETALLGGCRQLDVDARYAWWKWWWRDIGHLVNLDAHEGAIKVVADAFAQGATIEFGYIGSGWNVSDPAYPCRVVSHALVELRDEVPSPHEIMSFYDPP